MNYEKRFYAEAIERQMKNHNQTFEEAKSVVDDLKENNPEKYEMKMNEWFDTVHPY
jgi:hypothetical protein